MKKMKMRLTGFLAFTLLTISILSYGVSGAAFATSDPNPALPVSTDVDIASNGASVTVSGTIEDYDTSSGHGLTVLIISPDNNIVQIGQLLSNEINSDGSFTKSFIVGGSYWKVNGDYTIEFHYGADSSEVSVNYVGGEQVVSTPPPPPPVDNTPPPPPPVDNTPPPPVVDEEPACGVGTELVNGICQVVVDEEPPASGGGGCLIATAAYGTELAPQVQFLREIRDNTVMSTASGTSFMTGFNQLYYSFSPMIADLERENPMFQEVVRAFITPMISTLSIMTLAEDGSEGQVLGLGISVIALNLGMYIAAPALIGFKVHNHFKSRK